MRTESEGWVLHVGTYDGESCGSNAYLSPEVNMRTKMACALVPHGSVLQRSYYRSDDSFRLFDVAHRDSGAGSGSRIDEREVPAANRKSTD